LGAGGRVDPEAGISEQTFYRWKKQYVPIQSGPKFGNGPVSATSVVSPQRATELFESAFDEHVHRLSKLYATLASRGAIGLISARPWVWFDGAAGAESGGRESSTWVFCAI
jgi:hypothetical protein